MKKFIFTLFVFLVSPTASSVLCQPACGVAVTGSFDPECAYDFKGDYIDEFPNLMVACRKSTVTYTAHADAGVGVAEYIWEVYGDSLHSVSGNQMTVSWGSGTGWGMVVASVVTTAGDTCTEAARVKLISSPTAGASTIPAYTVMPDGSKVIRVCKGASVEFIDRSTADGSDIAAWHWECRDAASAPPASTPNYTIENISSDENVVHQAYNNCGCYDEETFLIEIIDGELLELDCYGTVCEGAVVQYRATAPSCADYHWYVDGGTLVGGQGTSAPVVQWSRTESGYGILGLDGVPCGDETCPALMTRKIPVISGNLSIAGDDDVCVGESVVYSLPLFGSTRYDWHVSPSTGVDLSMVNPSNEVRITFTAAGTYTITCDYQCDFLGCGPYEAAPLTVTVRPSFEITGDSRVCLGNTCSLSTVPAVSVTWTAYDLGAANTVAATGSGTTFSHAFTSTGRFLVTAEAATHCGPATFVVNVMAPPPAPTAADLDPDNRHAACPSGGITLRGTPSEAYYSLVWAPACTTATPQIHSGDSVTVHYAGEVCNVLVYNYDRELQCLSQTAYEYQVDTLMPDSLYIPGTLTVCPGSQIVWGDAQVPDQSADGMLYEWTMGNNSQHCASIVGDHQKPAVSLVINDIAPTTFDLNLKRSYCGGYKNKQIEIHIVDLSDEALSISGPDTVCREGSGSYTGSGSSGDYIWLLRDRTSTDNPVSMTFPYSGKEHVTLMSNPYNYCTNFTKLPTKIKNVRVLQGPPALGLQKSPGQLGQFVVEVVPSLGSGYSYQWQYMAPGSTTFSTAAPGGSSTLYVGAGVYRCTVSGANGCPKVLTWATDMDDINYGGSIVPISVDGSYNPCEGTLTFTVPSTAPYTTWAVQHDGTYRTPEQSGYNNHTATVQVDSVGIYGARAEVFLPDLWMVGCSKIQVEAIPDISFEAQCDRIKLQNNSLYADSSTMLHIRVENTCNNNIATFNLAAGTPSYVFIPSGLRPSPECVYTFILTGIGSNYDIEECVLGEATIIGDRQTRTVTLTSDNAANNNATCGNTPLGITASLSPNGTIATTNWSFGDGSSYGNVGNQVFHTFAARNNPYMVSAVVKDNCGCLWQSTSLSVMSDDNPFSGGILNTPPADVCPHTTPRTIQYTPIVASCTYTWYNPLSPPVTNDSSIHSTFYEGNYKVKVVNPNNCKAEALTYVPFKHAPTASIYTEKYNYCKGETVHVSGNPGPGSENYTYSWLVTPPSGSGLTFTTPDITFQALQAGSYTVTLSVTDPSSTCSSTATATITVATPPAAPTLSIVGSPCIADAPVVVGATGFSGEMHWNNGDTGSTADYYTPGLVTAYYYDPTIGCPSADGTVYIERQPDLDALLTGCYLKCSQQAAGFLPVYGLVPIGRQVWWKWNQGGMADSGYYTGDYQPLLLPLGYGDSYLTVGTPDTACKQTSAVLRIGEKQICDCDSVTVEYTVTPGFTDCHMTYKVYVTICNHTNKTFCITRLETLNVADNIHIMSENITGGHIDGNDCQNFLITLEALGIPPDVILLRLTDNECMYCTKEFSIVLSPVPECTDPLAVDLTLNTNLSSYVTGYFNFDIDAQPAQSILGLWTEPPMVVDWLANNDHANGLLMSDMGVLSQLADEDSVVCFHAIVCEGGTICRRTVCEKAKTLYNMVIDGVETPRWMHRKGTATAGFAPQLVPNPATDKVRVVSKAEVAEVVVMDLYGRRVLEPGGTTEMDVSKLPAGAYIVRVRTRQGDTVDRVDYLKLVKK